MRTDIDRLMKEKNLDAILITGAAQHNPYMVYITGGGHITKADLIKKRGQEPVLFHGPMERDEAAKTGLLTQSYSKYPWETLLKEANGDPIRAAALRYQRIFRDFQITGGRLALYGRAELSNHYGVFALLQRAIPDLEFVTTSEDDVLSMAMATKDEEEVHRIREIGKVTLSVVEEVADFLSKHAVNNQVLIKPDGTPLKVFDVKRYINRLLVERGAENPEDTIFAIGRDSAVPHSSGNPDDVIRQGETIVFDIFPCEASGGYFHDFTRTWSLGFAPEKVQELYEQVRSVYAKIKSSLKLNETFPVYQRNACEMFEQMGHPTPLSHPGTEEGYVHTIGHGVGLNIHEKPFCWQTDSTNNTLQPGSVITIEPGLYYPHQNLGIRLENTLLAHPDGCFEPLVDYPMELILPMRNSSTGPK